MSMVSACFNCASVNSNLSDMLIAGNIATRMSVLAFTSEVGRGSNTQDFVGHFRILNRNVPRNIVLLVAL